MPFLLIAALIFLSIAWPAFPQGTVNTLLNNGPRNNRINIVIVSEGYVAAESAKFNTDANGMLDSLMGQAPNCYYKKYFNAFSIFVASNQSGADHPAQNLYVDTYFSTSYDTIGKGRLLWPSDSGQHKLWDLLAAEIPDYDMAIMIVNDTETAGGGGGGLAVVPTNSLSPHICLHEMGHALASLADEWTDSYPGWVNRECPNSTHYMMRDSIPWKNWIDMTTPIPTPAAAPYLSVVGLFEGCQYQSTGWYRPEYNCLMRTSGPPLCRVCQERHIAAYYLSLRAYDTLSPDTATTLSIVRSGSIQLGVVPLQPKEGPLQAGWFLNGIAIPGKSTDSLVIFGDSLKNGLNNVMIVLSDTTTRVRNTDMRKWLQDTVHWNMNLIIPPAAPTLASPANNVTDQPLSLSLTWNTVPGASTYRVQLSKSSTFTSTVVDDSTLTSTSKAVGPLSNSTTYYWRVNVKNAGGTSAWSSVWSFTTIPPVPVTPTLSSPTNSAQNQLLNLTLIWNAVTGAVTYRTQVATDTGFNSIVTDDSTLSAASKAVGPLSAGTTYYWRINAKNPGGTSAWSEKWSFATIPPAPGTPTLVFPMDDAANVSINPIMTWSRVSGAATYRLQIGTDSLFDPIIIQDSTLTDTSKLCAALANDTKYFWRVNATNTGGKGVWSSVRRFTTIVALPSAVTLKSPAIGDTVRKDSVLLTWSAGTPKVDRYSVEYASDSSFTTSTIDSSVTDTVKLILNLEDNTNIWWRVKAHNAAGWGGWSAKYVFAVKLISTHAGLAVIPKTFSFNIYGRTGSIRYSLPQAEHVFLRFYSMKGQLQSEPVNIQQAAGYYTVNLQRAVVAAGSYVVVFKAGDYHQRKIVFLMK